VRPFLLWPLLTVACGCGPRLELGSDLLWSARHETGDLSEWTADMKGGSAADMPDTSIALSTEHAHGGRYAVKLTNAAVSNYEQVRLWRADQYPQAAYYSAWFYLPRAYETMNDWTIMQLRNPLSTDSTTISLLLDIDLRSLPNGDMIVSVYDHRQEYLRAATPDPAVPVPIGAWFQLQAFFDYSARSDGRFALWLNGRLLYDLPRAFDVNGTVYFTVCSVSQALSPTDSILYVDDATVSLTGVGADAEL